MKAGRILIAGIAATIFGAVFGTLTCGWLFKWVYTLEPTNIWKPIEAPPPAYFIGALVLNLVFAFIYALLNKGIPGKNRFIKGIVFGLCVWAVGVLPGMLATYFFMTIHPGVVLYWTIGGLIQTPITGLIIAAIYGQ
ncbi:MAG: hypothetical protein ACYSSI_03615 [Planctomycetota bacterium]|jgi:hypothetical protein